MNIFKRLLRIGQAEIHSAVDGMEDPIHMTEQGIREMKDDLEKALEGLAQVKAIAIRAKNDKIKKQESAQDYETKAVLLLSKAQKGELSMEEAEKLAKEALALKESLLVEIEQLSEQQEKNEESAEKMQKDVEILKFNIMKWENELKTLKTRMRASRATQEVNKQMARMDNNSTIDMLERMKEKIEEEEALAQAYGEVAEKNISIDEEINNAINEGAKKVNTKLEEIKKNLGII
ncbi:MAG: PspA/IM30 family protein [Dysgonomonas sp.]|nr:PspA/IM30 family protein [Dysgonomonas sp.]